MTINISKNGLILNIEQEMVKTTMKLWVWLALLILNGSMRAQLSGSYNVPINYATIAAAIIDLNAQGVSGPVFINIGAGYSEIAPAGGFSLTATGTALNPITFRKIGAGPNPVITAFTGGAGTPATAVQDGVWRFIGSDYITIDGINIVDPNVTNPATMEYGFGLFKASTSDGCHFNTIQNCVVTLNRFNNATGVGPAADGSRAINVVNSLHNTQTTVLTPVSASGGNSNNKFYNNTLQNCNIGIALIGYTAPSPFTLADTGNDVGGLTFATGNIIINFGGATGATNPAAGVRTLSQYDLNVSGNMINNNNGSGINHVTTLRGIYVNTAQSANVTVNSNTISVNSAATTAQVSAIENSAGSTALNNTVSINNNLISSSTCTTNTTGSFIGIFNNGASSSYLRISDNTFSAINTRASTGNNYLIYNTGAVTTAITFTNNLISACTNSASSSGSYYAIQNNAVSAAVLNISNNTFTNNSSFASTGATHLIYNTAATSNSITMSNNTVSSWNSQIGSSGAFYGIFNNGVTPAALDMSANTFISNTLSATSGPVHLIYNTAAASSSILLNNNLVANNTHLASTTGPYYAIYNNAASSAFLDMSNNSFTGNVSSVGTGSVFVLYNRGAVTNTFASASFNNNIIGNYTFSTSSTAPFFGLHNAVVTSGNLSIANNTVAGSTWSGTGSARFLFFNSGPVSSALSFNNNLVTGCSSTLNTTGSFNGLLNTGTCSLSLSMCGNTISNFTNTASTGGSYLIFNSGAVPSGVITMTNNLVSSISNSATGAGDFYGIHNLGTVFTSLDISSNTFTNTTLSAFSGATNLIYHTGAVSTSISNINLNNNLISALTASIGSTGSFYGIYNNASSSASLSMNNNTFTNSAFYGGTGALHLIYNRGAATNTFNSVAINNNLISSCTASSTATAAFYTIWNNGVTSAITSVASNTIANCTWSTTSSLRYLISNAGVNTGSVSIVNNNISNCTNTLNASGTFYAIYNTATSTNGNITISNNLLDLLKGTATNGDCYLISNSGATANNIVISDNIVSNCSYTATTTGSYYHLYNNAASTTSLEMSRNTFTADVSNMASGATHLVYNRGTGTNTYVSVVMSDNLVAGCTHSASGAGIFYGILNSGGSSSSITLSGNTYSGNISLTGTSNLYLLYNTGTASSSIDIVNNLVSGYSNTLTTSGTFFVINNGGNSAGNLTISGNTFTNISSSSSTGSRYMIYNSGGVSNTAGIINNLISNCTHSVSGTGSTFGINNNSSLSGLNLNLSNNTFTNNFSSLTTGNTYVFLNSGVVSTTVSNVTFSSNVVSNYTSVATSGPFYGIFNSAITSTNLSITSNTLTDIVSLATTSARQLVMNNGRVTSSISINDNLLQNYTSTLNTTGTFNGIVNTLSYASGNFPAALSVNNNRFENTQLSASTGGVFMINTTGVASNTVTSLNINNTLCNNLSATITAGGSYYGIYLATISAASLSVGSNSIINSILNSTTSARFMIFNGATIVNAASISNNYFSNVTSTVNTTGSYYAINNGGNSAGNLSIDNNTITNHTLSASTGSVFGVYNTGIITNTVQAAGNIITNVTHGATASGGFSGIYNNAGSSAAAFLSANTFSNIQLSTLTGASQFIYNRSVATSTINNLSVTNNTVISSSYSATSGPFYGVFNSGTSTGSLNVSGNVFNGIVSTASASSRYFIYNTGAASSLISVTSNLVSNYTASLNTTGLFYNVINSGASAGNLDISANTFSNQTLPATTGTSYAIYNNGVITTSTTIGSNLITGLSYTSSTGFFYGAFNNGVNTAGLSITNNTLDAVVATNSTSPKYLIYNTAAVSGSLSMSNNLISNYTGTFNTTGNFYGVYNTGNSGGNLGLSSNTLTGLSLSATSGNVYMVSNTGTVSNNLGLNSNLISNVTSSASVNGVFYGIYNLCNAATALSLSGNTFSTLSLFTPTMATYMVYTAPASATVNINSVSMDNNAVNTCTYNSNTGPFYGIYNNGVSSASLSLSGNTFSNCVASTSISPLYMVYNTGTVSSAINLNSNVISGLTASVNTAGIFYGVYNTAASANNISLNGNSFAANLIHANTVNTYLVYNTAQATNSIAMSTNSVSGTNNPVAVSGNFYGVYNTGASGSLLMSGNQFTNNTSSATTANTHLIYNTGATINSVQMNANTLGYGFTNTVTDYSGILYNIYNAGTIPVSSVTINGNNFTSYPFTGVNGSGNIYFIHNVPNSSTIDISNNTWTNPSLKHNGNEYLIYNPSGTQNSLSVTNNSIIGGYTRTGNAGSMFLYYSSAASPASCTQVFSGNNFSNITANTQGTGSFHGIYNVDGSTSALPIKNVFNNVISNVTYNGVGFMYPYYFDYLGGTSSSSSSVHDNTLTAITWGGPLYGLYVGGNISSLSATQVYSNTFTNLNSTGTTSDLYGSYLMGGGLGLDYYKNKVGDIISNGILGNVHGLYVAGASNTRLFNNLVGTLGAPVSSATNPLNGITIAGGSLVKAYYNTVYLNAASTGSNFGSNALNVSSAVTLDLRNNVLINTSSSSGNGVTVAYRRSSTSLGTYSSTSNNNIYYAGIPGSTKHIFYDGSTFYSTLPAFQTLVATRDNASVWENTPFLSTVVTSTNYLHVDPTIPSLTESGAVNITGITDDFDAQVRQGNTGYTGSGTAPDIGADEYNQNLTPCSSANAGTVIIPSSSTLCAGETIYLFSTGYTAAGSIVHQWKVSSSPGGTYTNVSGGNGANYIAYSTPTLSSGMYYYVMVTTCTLGSFSGTSNEVTVTVNAVPGVTATASTPSICSGQALNFSASTNIGTSYLWSGPNNFTSGVQSPTVANAGSNSSGVYTLVVSNTNCTAMPVYVTATVHATPPSFSLTPSAASMCVGASQTVSASIPLTTPTLSFGSQSNVNSATGYPAPYSVYYGGQKTQILILAAELISSGYTGGSPISSIEFPVVSLGSNWGGSLQALQNFMISAKSTTATQLSTFETGLANVLGPISYTPVPGTNQHVFASPFIWDGSSNLVIQTVFSNSLVGTPGNAVIQYNSSTGFQSTLVYRADNQSAATIAAASNTNVNVGFVRPDFKLNGQVVGTYSWGPSTGLSSTSSPTITASPTVSTIYTATLSNGLCTSNASMALNVILIPTVNIASTAATVCVGNSATLTATGATSYTWSTNVTGSVAVVSPFVTSNYTVTGSNPACPNAMSSVNLVSAPALTLVTTASPAAICYGQVSTLSVTGASTYTWTGGATGSTLAVSPTLTTNYNVTGYNGPGCWANKVTLVKVNSLPVITVQPPSASLCVGEYATFEAGGVFSFTWSPGNSNSPIITVNPPASIIYTVTGSDANNCSNTAMVTIALDPCVGLQTNQLFALAGIHPNPSTGLVHLNFETGAEHRIIVRNVAGAIVLDHSGIGQTGMLELGELAKGMYVVTVNERNIVRNYKLILE